MFKRAKQIVRGDYKEILNTYIAFPKKEEIQDLLGLYLLLQDKLSLDLIRKYVDPLGLGGAADLPSSDEVINIIHPTLSTLIGEETEALKNIRAMVINPDAVSEKEKLLEEAIVIKLQNLLPSLAEKDDDDLKSAFEDIQFWMTFNWQDQREIVANHIIKHYMSSADVESKRTQGYKNLLTVSEEHYHIQEIDGDLVIEVVSPFDILVYGAKEKDEDADVIVIRQQLSASELIDRYRDDLSKSDMDAIFYYEKKTKEKKDPIAAVRPELRLVGDNELERELSLLFRSSGVELQENDVYQGLTAYVVYYKRLRKIGQARVYDPVTDSYVEELVDEHFVPDKDYGESVEWKYIVEWWRAVRIEAGSKTIDIKGKPLHFQRYKLNMTKPLPPVVGGRMMYDSLRARSLVERLKPVQMSFVLAYVKAMRKMGKDIGNILSMNLALMPKGFTYEKMMAWVKDIGVFPYAPLLPNEKMQYAAQFGAPLQAIPTSAINDVIGLFRVMAELKNLADDIGGVNRQRRGDVSTSDAVGVTQAAITRSYTITKEINNFHIRIIERLFTAIIDYVKFLISIGKMHIHKFFTVDIAGDLYSDFTSKFTETEYDIKVEAEFEAAEQEKMFMEMLGPAIQTGMLDVADVMYLQRIRSADERIKYMQRRRKEREQMQMQIQKQQMEIESQKAQLELKKIQMMGQFDIEKIKTEKFLDLLIERTKVQGRKDLEEIRRQAKKELEELRQQFEEDFKQGSADMNSIVSSIEKSKITMPYMGDLNSPLGQDIENE